MSNRFIFFILFFISTQSFAVWEIPNTPQSGMGDPGSFYLNKQGLTLHLFNNDYVGYTDKLNTASGSLYLYMLSGAHGWEVSAHRRLLTPIIKTRFGEDPYSPPKGVYADQLEGRIAYSFTEGHTKIEAHWGYEYYAGLGGDNVAKFIHKVIGAKDETAKYGPKINNNFISGTIGFGFLSQYALLMFYAHNGPTMQDATARLSFKFGTDYQFGIQGEISEQFRSTFYGREFIKPNRHGYGISYKHGWYQFTANYISPYLKYDKYGQYYLSPLIISYEF